MDKDYVWDRETGKVTYTKPRHYSIKDLFKYNIMNFEIMPEGWGEYMSIKDNIKCELLEIIRDEEDLLTRRQEVNARTSSDNYDASCEDAFLQKLKKFVQSI